MTKTLDLDKRHTYWYAGCDGIMKMGPFGGQEEAWDKLRLNPLARFERVFADGAQVWPESEPSIREQAEVLLHLSDQSENPDMFITATSFDLGYAVDAMEIALNCLRGDLGKSLVVLAGVR